jgi:hypothetical protein
MRIITGLAAVAGYFFLSMPPYALAHGTRELVNPPPGVHHRAPPAPQQLAPTPGMFNPPPPLLQAPSPFVTPAIPYTGWQIAPIQPPPHTYGDPSLRDRRLFEDELRLRQWHEHALRRPHGAGEHRRWREDHHHR